MSPDTHQLDRPQSHTILARIVNLHSVSLQSPWRIMALNMAVQPPVDSESVTQCTVNHFISTPNRPLYQSWKKIRTWLVFDIQTDFIVSTHLEIRSLNFGVWICVSLDSGKREFCCHLRVSSCTRCQCPATGTAHLISFGPHRRSFLLHITFDLSADLSRSVRHFFSLWFTLHITILHLLYPPHSLLRLGTPRNSLNLTIIFESLSWFIVPIDYHTTALPTTVLAIPSFIRPD